MSSSSLAARLRKILPFIGRNTASADRECYLRAFRRLYSEDPMAFSEVFDDELEKLRSEYPREITELIEQAGYAELDDQIVAAEREDGSVTTLYAAGFLAYGLENQALAAENLTREDAEKLRALLLNEYFDESVAKIQIYEHLMPINHRAFVDAGESQRFLRQMMRSKGDFIATFDSIDMPGIDYTLDEEDGTDIAARFRLILFTVRTPRGEKPALKRPFRFLGFATNEGKNAVLTSEAILKTRWGAELTALLSVRCGRGLRFCVTEPTLLNDTVRQLDYVTGLKRIMVVFTRTALDENVPPENLIVSLGAFSGRGRNRQHDRGSVRNGRHSAQDPHSRRMSLAHGGARHDGPPLQLHPQHSEAPEKKGRRAASDDAEHDAQLTFQSSKASKKARPPVKEPGFSFGSSGGHYFFAPEMSGWPSGSLAPAGTAGWPSGSFAPAGISG